MTIKEVSEITGFSSHTLRYYEKEGVIQDIRRDSSGFRDYQQNDVEILQFLSCLKKAEMSIERIKDFTSLLYNGDSTIQARISLLEEQEELVKNKLQETQEVYDHITWKIKYYKDRLK